MEVKTLKKVKKVALTATSLVLVGAIGFSCASCKKDEETFEGYKQGTYRTYTSTMPSNWNELTYQDNNDTQILDYIVGALFTYDYEFSGDKYNEDGSINTAAIVPGSFSTQYEAVSAVEDVTEEVASKWGYTADQVDEGGYAWRLTLRQDLKWDDGTAIDASDFVYSMQEQLNPKFLNFRSSTWYQDVPIKGAYNYLYQGAPLYTNVINENYDNHLAMSSFTQDEDGYYLFPDSYGTADDDAHIYASTSQSCMFFGSSMYDYYSAGYNSYFYEKYEGEIDDPENLPDYVIAKEAADGTVTYYTDLFAKLADKENEYGYFQVDDEIYAALMTISANFGDGSELSWEEFCFYISGYGETYSWDTVGFYQEGNYELVLCMDNPIQLLKDDGSLSYLSAYYLSNLPLVKKDVYEKSKQEPVSGAILWTSTYNSSLETTASWGPYKLTSFQAGKSYTLERNEYWYGWNMEEYKNQYNVTKLECERISEENTAWMSFFGGKIDSKGLDNDHLDAYKSSKYVYFSAATGTFGLQIYAGLDAIKTNGRNNGILAIDEFRQAMSLALDRGEFASDILAPNQAAYGVLNSQYYYDVENGGAYRYTTQAKEGLLRAYGYTQADDGTWSNATGSISGYTTDDAYDTLGGSNMSKATELVEAAYEKLTANAEYYGYDSSKQITILVGWSSTSTSYSKAFEYMKEKWEAMVEGTPLEGKLNITYDENRGSTWSDDFKKGVYDIFPLAGISGNPLNPYALIQCYIDPGYSLNYHQYWDTNEIPLTITFGEDDSEYSGKTITMSALNWFFCLNGLAATYKDSRNLEYTYVMSDGYLSEANRLLILAALEELVLEKYQFVPLVSSYSATLLSAKFSYISDDYNMFTGFGGLRYIIVNYTDSEWETFVSSQGNDLTEYYKVSE